MSGQTCGTACMACAVWQDVQTASRYVSHLDGAFGLLPGRNQVLLSALMLDATAELITILSQGRGLFLTL